MTRASLDDFPSASQSTEWRRTLRQVRAQRGEPRFGDQLNRNPFGRSDFNIGRFLPIPSASQIGPDPKSVLRTLSQKAGWP
eukprot:6897575-Prymnesium_polylepis.1